MYARLQSLAIFLSIFFLSFPKFAFAAELPIQADVSGAAEIRSGQSSTYAAHATGSNLTTIAIYRARTDSYLDYESNWQNNPIAGPSTCESPSDCSISGTWDPVTTEIGQWYVAVVVTDADGNRCIGNPHQFGSWASPEPGTPTWYRCSDSDQDFKLVKVDPPPGGRPTPTSKPAKGKNGKKPTPTPIHYSCHPDPNCSGIQQALHFCRLVCDRI